MRTITFEVFQYAELSDKAKERARDWLREANAGDNFFANCIEEDFRETLAALGFDPYRYGMDLAAHTRTKQSTVEWSGFSSQGDGAAFSGTWRAADCNPGKLLADRPVCATVVIPPRPDANAEMHRIAAEILACKDAGMSFATIDKSTRGHCMLLDLTEWAEGYAPCDEPATEARFIKAARDLARAFYKTLQSEYEYQNADEQIAENIVANDYEFYADGRRAP